MGLSHSRYGLSFVGDRVMAVMAGVICRGAYRSSEWMRC